MMARGTPNDQYTNATSVIYRVYFSEAVTGVDASDFYLYLDPGLGGTIGTCHRQWRRIQRGSKHHYR
jgi:hypothetical protein